MKTRAACVTALLMTAGSGTAQVFVQDHKLADDDVATQLFGHGVAISGTTALAGAMGGADTGSAHLFDALTGQELLTLTPEDADVSQFGSSVALAGPTAVVGAPANDNASIPGAVYVFDATTGQQLFKLTADDVTGTDGFGHAVALSGDTLLVGAQKGDGTAAGSGAAYLFDVTTGQQLGKLTAVDGAASDFFGDAVALSGTTAVVGARRDNNDTGAAYVFDTTTGGQLFKLIGDDAVTGDQFGIAAAIAGNTAVVGTRSNDGGAVRSGAAYIFDLATGLQLQKLTPNDPTIDASFGSSIAVSGTTAVIGAPFDNDGGHFSGSAYIFDLESGLQHSKIIAGDASSLDLFGFSVSISGTGVVIGAPFSDGGAVDSGSAYLFMQCLAPCIIADYAIPFCVLNIDDIDAFITAFLGGDLLADCDASGSLNVDDIDCFVAAFLAGCP